MGVPLHRRGAPASATSCVACGRSESFSPRALAIQAGASAAFQAAGASALRDRLPAMDEHVTARERNLQLAAVWRFASLVRRTVQASGPGHTSLLVGVRWRGR